MIGEVAAEWRRASGLERAAYLTGAVLLISGLVHLATLLVTGGSWEGPLSLRKPATFGLSFGMTLITIVWVTSFLQLSDRLRAAALTTFTAACVLETFLVSLQAWRGAPSHFNLETSFDGWVARLLAAGGLVLVIVIVALTVAAFRASSLTPRSMRIAIQTGFVILVASMATGALMIAKGMMLVFAGDQQAAYATGGLYKPTHAVTMHAILVLPLTAWLLSLSNMSERRQITVVLIVSAAYVIAAAAVAAMNVTLS